MQNCWFGEMAKSLNMQGGGQSDKRVGAVPGEKGKKGIFKESRKLGKRRCWAGEKGGKRRGGGKACRSALSLWGKGE